VPVKKTNKIKYLKNFSGIGLSSKPDSCLTAVSKPLFCIGIFVSSRRQLQSCPPVQLITPDNRRRCPDFGGGDGRMTAGPALARAGR
jgi:hypothetical protein